MKTRLLLLNLICGLVAASCASPPANQTSMAPVLNLTSSTAAAQKKPEHEHHPPHGGTLVVLGKEFAHLELVLDQANGKLCAYALDGEAETAVKLTQPDIEIEIIHPIKYIVKLNAVENALTGEKQGATSEFAGQGEQLKNLSNFDGEIYTIFIKGQQFNQVSFNFPKGNEE